MPKHTASGCGVHLKQPVHSHHRGNIRNADKILGGDYDLRPHFVTINKNRIFLDDIKVE
jgi:hypothetical protein